MTNHLEKYFHNNKKNIIHKWDHYFDIYQKHFSRFVGTDCIIVEIGVSKGGSLQMWKAFFGAKAKIYGIDINPHCKEFEEDNIQVFIGSQADRTFLNDFKSNIPKIDILIDDGSHISSQQLITFEELFDYIQDDGIYLCEDIHTSYLESYGGGLKKPSTFIEYSKTLIDKLNAWHIPENELLLSSFTRSTNSLHFYDSILVIEKQKRQKPWHEKRGRINSQRIKEENVNTNEFLELKFKILGEKIPENYNIEKLTNNISEINRLLEDKFEGRSWPKEGETMIGYTRLSNIENCIINTINNNVEGDLIETGVWRGGACIFMRAILMKYGITNKNVWVADSFEGLPKPNPELYPSDKNDKHHTHNELKVSIDEVKNNFEKYDLLDNQVIFLKGWFKDTIPNATIDKLSVLRLDGDMYESTIDVLFHLYPKLSVGGYCIIDDWGAVSACKKAVQDYRHIFDINEEIIKIDWAGVFWKKTKTTAILSRSLFNEMISKNKND